MSVSTIERKALVKKATDDYEVFWADYAKEKIDWIEPFTNVLPLLAVIVIS